MSIERVSAFFRALLFEIKRDPKAREALRPLALALVFFFAVNYAINTFFLKSYEKRLSALQAKRLSLQNTLRDKDIFLGGLSRLAQEKAVLEKKLERLEFKRKILTLERSKVADVDTFRRILLGIGPGIPHLRSFDLVKIVRQDGASGGLVALQGELSFEELLKYLDYLERRQEVGYLDKLNITEDFCDQGRKRGKASNYRETICFQLVAGREHVVSASEKGGEKRP